MYSLPSTSVSARALAGGDDDGSPPTPRKARTGLLTPPGRYFCASAKIARERSTLRSGIDDLQ